jgi:DNA-binding MarR family transcriptional regulator
MKRKTASTDSTPDAASKPTGPEFWAEVLRTCGSFNLRKATRVVTQLYDDILQPTGLRSTQVVLLVALAAAGEMSMSYMARELIMSPSTLSRTLIPLERDGLIAITPSGKRGKLVRLTPAGESALTNAVPYWQKAQETFLAQAGAAAWTELNERLAGLVAATRRSRL